MRVLLLLLSLALPAAAQAGERVVLVLGDSLSAGYGLASGQAWPSLLSARLAQTGCTYQVVNASISGETSSGGLSRIAGLLAQHKPAVLVVALGANDGLRGLPVQQLTANLTSILQQGVKSGAKTLLVGMRLPPNYGPGYTKAFEAGFSDVAKAMRSAWVPFLLERIATDPGQFQRDGLHPVASAQPALLETVWPGLQPLLACGKGR